MVLKTWLAAGMLGSAGLGVLVWWVGPWSAPFRYEHMDLVSLRQRLDSSPKDALGWRTLGLRLAREGDASMAVPALLQAYTLNPSDSVVATGLGEIYTSAGRYAEAFQFLKAATAQKPPNAFAYMALGRLYRRKASYLHASEAFEMVVKLDPKLSDAWYEMAICYLQMQQAAKATDAIAAAIRLEPMQPEYLALQGSIDVAVGKLDEGFAITQRAAKLVPSNLKIQSNYANMLLTNHRNTEDLQKAEQVIGILEQINPQYSLLPYQHGQLEQLRGHWPQAVRYLERAVQTAPEQDEVYYALSQAYRRVHRVPEADRMAMLYRRRQNLRRQIDAIRIQLGGQADNSMLYARLAELQIQTGDTPSAISSLKAALKIAPDQTALKIRLAQLERQSAPRNSP